MADDGDGDVDASGASELVQHGVGASFASGNDDVVAALANGFVHNCVAVWPLVGGHADGLGPFEFGDSRWRPIGISAGRLIPESFVTRNACGQRLQRPPSTAKHESIVEEVHGADRDCRDPYCYGCRVAACADVDADGDEHSAMDGVVTAFGRLFVPTLR